MIYNGELATSKAVIYTAPLPTPGIPSSGSNVTVNFFRVVNTTAALRTFNLYLSVNGNDVSFIPIDTELPPGAAWDDVPVFQLPPGGTISGDADAAGVSWTINVIQ